MWGAIRQDEGVNSPLLARLSKVVLVRLVLVRLALIACVLLMMGSTGVLPAQEAHHAGASVPSTRLTLRTADGKTMVFSPEQLRAMPHVSVVVMNGHTNANESYGGVLLSSLLAMAGVAQGEAVKGSLLLTGVVAEGTDGYKVLYSIAEVDPAQHTGDVIVADTLDGKKLGSEGAFKLVSSEDKRPARWVRNLSALSVISVAGGR